jgi:hypothetical protein
MDSPGTTSSGPGLGFEILANDWRRVPSRCKVCCQLLAVAFPMSSTESICLSPASDFLRRNCHLGQSDFYEYAHRGRYSDWDDVIHDCHCSGYSVGNPPSQVSSQPLQTGWPLLAALLVESEFSILGKPSTAMLARSLVALVLGGLELLPILTRLDGDTSFGSWSHSTMP